MKALILKERNSFPERGEIEYVQGANEVEVNIRAAAINRRDYWICRGQYPGIKLPMVLGSDGCGHYKGSDVIINPGLFWGRNEAVQSDKFEVLGLPHFGTFAEKVSVPEELIFAKPSHLDTVEAAALPLAGVTAYRAVFTKGELNSGKKVLITGIGGGVALMALAYAVAAGAEVYVTSSQDTKIQKAKDQGAVDGANYKEDGYIDKLRDMTQGVDLVIDSAGGEGFSKLAKICNPGAKMVFYGGTNGEINNLSPQLIFWRQITICGTTMGSEKDFMDMLAFVTQHKIVPVVDSVFKLDKVDDAFARMKEGKQFGKIVFEMS